jgi:hypothetical protein
MEKRNFVGGAVRTTLSANIAANTIGMVDVVDGSTFPLGGSSKLFVIALGRGTINEEKVLINTRTGNALDINSAGRGYDGTTAYAHPAGTTVDHVLDAVFLQDVSDEVNAIIDSGASRVDSAESIIASQVFS